METGKRVARWERWIGSFRIRLTRAILLPLIIALPPLFWVIDATNRASLATLGRDQGIFQYVAWALQRGAVDYRDVRDVNGPLTHFVHLVLLAFGGADEHRFRVLDLAITGVCFALVGACLPGIVKKKVWWIERIAWAFAAWVVLSGQHLMYLYWDLAQRESFFNWFMLCGVGLQLVAQRALARPAPSPAAEGERAKTRFGLGRESAFGVVVLGLAGALGAIPCFGKPTYVLFTLVQLFTLWVDREITLSQKRRFVIFAAGAAVGAATQVLFLLRYADIGAFLRIYFVDVPAMYRFILPRTAVEILALQWGGAPAALAAVTSLVHFGLVREGQMPRRTLSFALIPLAGLIGVLVQGKGFPYHFHPVTAGLHLQWLLLVVWLSEKFGQAPRARERPPGSTSPSASLQRLVPYGAAAALAMKIGLMLPTSPHVTNLWILSKARDRLERASHDYLVYFRDLDFFPWEMRQTSRYLRAYTQPTDRVQIYGMDPYVLFLAERMSATPYIYAYDLNVDAALGGSWMPDGPRPNPKQAELIMAMRDAHERDMLVRLKSEPPAAFVFFDKSPLISSDSAVADFAEHCPESAAWVREHYRETAVFGEDRIWMRNDVAERIAATGPSPE